MPIFQKRAQDGQKSQKAPAKSVTPVPTGTGGRRSLSMVGKALADVVNSRKANYTSLRPSARILAKVIESSSNTDESSTAVDPSLARQPNQRVSSNPRRSGSISSTRVTPPKCDGSVVSHFSPSKGAGRGKPVTRGGFRKDGTPSPTTSRGESGSGALFRTSKSIDVDTKLRRGATSGSPTLRWVAKSSPSTSATHSVVGSPASPHPPDTMTIESNAEEAPPSPLGSMSAITRASSIKVMKGSALPQPKVRPRSSIFMGIAPLAEPLEISKQKTEVSLFPSENRSSAGDDDDRNPIAVLPRQDTRGTTSSDKKVPPSPNEGKDKYREPSPTPSTVSMLKRPFSPLPGRILRSQARRGTGNAGEPLKANSDTSDTHKAWAARPSSITAKRRSGLPLPSSVVASHVAGESSTGGGIVPRRSVMQEDSSTSDEPPTSFKKRKSDASFVDPRSISRKLNNVSTSPGRLSISTSRPSDLPTEPKTPSISEVAPRGEQTFSIPRNRLINFSFAGITLPNDVDNPDLDETSVLIENSISLNHHDPDVGPLTPSASLSTLFLPPSQPCQSPGPSRAMSQMVRRSKPGTAPVSQRTTRPSLTLFDAIAERSHEYSDEVNVMLSEVPAPFTPDVRGSSLLLTTPGSSELSFDLDRTDVQTMSGPPSPIGQSHSQKSVVTSSISQLLFLPSTNPSVMSSPCNPGSMLPAHPTLDPTATEREIMELHLKVAAHEAAARAQEARVANLEAEVATAYSVTRSRESAHQVGLQQLAGELAHRYAEGLKKDWNHIAEMARMEQDCLATERSALHALSLALDVNILIAQ